MGVASHREVVVPVLQNVGSGIVRVVACQVLFLHCNLKVLRRSGGNLLLVKAAQLHRGLLHPVVLVVLGVRALEVDLHRVLAVHRTGVGHVHTHQEGVPLVLHREVGVLKGGIAQAVAEGERHVCIVVILSGVALAENIVLIPGLIVPVAHVDALLVHHVVLVALGDAGIGVVLGSGSVIFRGIGIGVGAEVLHGRRGVVVPQEGVHKPAGGVDVAGQDIGHAIDAGHAHVADPQHRVDAVVVHKVQLEAVGGIEEHHDLLEHALLLQGLQILKHLHLFLAQPEVVAVGHIGLQLGQSAGQVGTLAAGAGQHHKSHIAVVGPSGLEGIGVLAPGHLVDPVLSLIAAGGVGIHPLIAAGGIELPLVRVDGVLAERPVQGGLQRYRVIGGHLAGAGTAVQQIEAGLRKGGELRALGQRQSIVPVHQEGSSLLLDLLAQFLFIGHQVLFALVIAPEVNGSIGIRHNFLGLRVQRHINRRGKCRCHRNSHNADHQENSCDRGQHRPQLTAFFLLHGKLPF